MARYEISQTEITRRVKKTQFNFSVFALISYGLLIYFLVLNPRQAGESLSIGDWILIILPAAAAIFCFYRIGKAYGNNVAKQYFEVSAEAIVGYYGERQLYRIPPAAIKKLNTNDSGHTKIYTSSHSKPFELPPTDDQKRLKMELRRLGYLKAE